MTSRFVFSYFQDYKFARTLLVDDFRIWNGIKLSVIGIGVLKWGKTSKIPGYDWEMVDD